jgi:hypothetical protein
MFEPENDIERALIRASHQPAERPAGAPHRNSVIAVKVRLPLETLQVS